jgi:hypothetical protein
MLGTKPSTAKAKPVSDEGLGVATATLATPIGGDGFRPPNYGFAEL